MTDWAGQGWSIDVDQSGVRVVGRRQSFDLGAAEAESVTLRRGVLGWKLRRPDRRPERIRGMRRPVAAKVRAALARVSLDEELRACVRRYEDVRSSCEHGVETGRWVPWDARDAFLAGRKADLPERLRRSGAMPILSERDEESLAFGPEDMVSLVDSTNERILASELRDRRDFFDTVESRPLTDEQARAVVTFDNRVQVLAAAGSGKTSVMVARAAYAVARGFVRPERILLLAFNTRAAKELQERVEARFEAAGLRSDGVRASTFHSFGLSVIGAATGRKPSLAPWVASGRESQKISDIVDQLRDSNKTFRYQWDLYRLVFARVPLEPGSGVPDAYDRDRRESGHETLKGDIVRSEGERMIADWLFINGVDFVYEAPYVIDVADPLHRQYTPDFYYPEIDAWHEHWALDRDGNPPAEFKGYAAGMRWKRSLHADHGTDLIETTFAEIVLGDGGFSGLEEALVSRGVTLDWNPDREFVKEPVSHDQMVKLIRTFLSHVKSSQARKEVLYELLNTTRSRLAGARTRVFLDVFWPVFDVWNEELRAGGYVDFDDMLGTAADLIAFGHDPGCDLVLVDEFQDSSQARARIVDGLVAPGSRYLMAVGDDWQAINRFAGADLAVMTHFSDRFGPGPQLALTTTFRCSQVICDLASQFVSKNRRQFDKAMRSVEQEDRGSPVEIVFADEPLGAVKACLERVSKEAGPAGASVFVLGRYKFERGDALPDEVPANLQVEFRTVHSSKGAESDYVIISGMKSGTYGFPSTIADDPVLDLVMGEPDTFEHAEERRLLYVALTRARRGVYLIASVSHPSPFVTELLEARSPPGSGQLVVQVDELGNPIAASEKVRPCPRCNAGTLVSRTSVHGPFFGCSQFPGCNYTEKDDGADNGHAGPVSQAGAAAPDSRRTMGLCPRCGAGELKRRSGKFGAFFGCTRFPACRYTRNA